MNAQLNRAVRKNDQNKNLSFRMHKEKPVDDKNLNNSVAPFRQCMLRRTLAFFWKIAADNKSKITADQQEEWIHDENQRKSSKTFVSYMLLLKDFWPIKKPGL